MKKKNNRGRGRKKEKRHSCFGTLWVRDLCYMCLPFNSSSFYLLHVHVGDCRPPSRRIVLHKYTETDGTSHLCVKASKQAFRLLWQRRKKHFQNLTQSLEETVHPNGKSVIIYSLSFCCIPVWPFYFQKGWILNNVLFTLALGDMVIFHIVSPWDRRYTILSYMDGWGQERDSLYLS